VAMADLVLALARATSRKVGQLGPTGSPDPRELQALVQAFECMEAFGAAHLHSLVKEEVHGQPTPDLQQLLLSRSVMPCITLVLASAAYAWPAEQRQLCNAQTEGINSSSTTSSSCSSSSTHSSDAGNSSRLLSWRHDSQSDEASPAAVKSAWQKTRRQAASLPASHMQLCAALGIDVKLMPTISLLTANAAQPQSGPESCVTPPGLVHALVDIWGNVLHLWESGPTRQLWQQKPAAQKQIDLQLLLLLPGVLGGCTVLQGYPAAAACATSTA
jgi:hypothetical protein